VSESALPEFSTTSALAEFINRSASCF